MKSTRLHITRAALVQRLTRRLRRDGEHLRKARGQGMQIEVGDFYTVMDGCIFRTHIHLEELARKLGLLQEWETVAASYPLAVYTSNRQHEILKASGGKSNE